MKNIVNWIKTTILKMRMHYGVVSFSYIKKDGTTREAHGTLKRNLLPALVGTGRKPSKDLFVYYDTEAQGWRSFYKHNLLTI